MEFLNKLNKLKKLPWQRIGLISLCSFLTLVLITMIFVTAFAERMLNKIGRPNLGGNETLPSDVLADLLTKPTLPPDFTGETINPDDITLPDTPDVIIQHKDLINIMLVGQDRRPGETYNTRSDSMILCSFNLQDNTFTMTSFMRDMYVQIPGFGGNKMNAAYQFGGMNLLAETMSMNFGVQVDAFVEVDFNGFKGVMDVLGGVDIKLSALEAEYINNRYTDSTEGGDWPLKAGVNHLNSGQALYYSRIRYIGTDFERTERQRKVINAIISKVKNVSLTQMVSLVDQVLPMLRTDMSNSEITNYLFTLFPMLSSASINSQRIPVDGTYSLTWVGALDVVLPDLQANREYLVNTLIPD